MDDSDHDNDDSSGSSSSTTTSEERIFKPLALPLILELHDIRKDDPSMPTFKTSDSVPPTTAGGVKIKKHKKGKKKAVPGAKSTSSVSTASLSDTSSVAPSATDVKEEFYDAHESYHAIPENQIPVALATALTAGPADTSIDPAKAPDLATATSEPQTTTAATTGKEPSPVIKPTAPP